MLQPKLGLHVSDFFDRALLGSLCSDFPSLRRVPELATFSQASSYEILGSRRGAVLNLHVLNITKAESVR